MVAWIYSAAQIFSRIAESTTNQAQNEVVGGKKLIKNLLSTPIRLSASFLLSPFLLLIISLKKNTPLETRAVAILGFVVALSLSVFSSIYAAFGLGQFYMHLDR